MHNILILNLMYIYNWNNFNKIVYIDTCRYSSKVYGYSYPEPSYHPGYHHPPYQTIHQTIHHPAVLHYQVDFSCNICILFSGHDILYRGQDMFEEINNSNRATRRIYNLHTGWPVTHARVFLVPCKTWLVNCTLLYSSVHCITFYNVPEQYGHVYMVGLYVVRCHCTGPWSWSWVTKVLRSALLWLCTGTVRCTALCLLGSRDYVRVQYDVQRAAGDVSSVPPPSPPSSSSTHSPGTTTYIQRFGYSLSLFHHWCKGSSKQKMVFMKWPCH